MDISLIPTEERQGKICFCCGENRSVKYKTNISGVNVYFCNLCAPKMFVIKSTILCKLKGESVC